MRFVVCEACGHVVVEGEQPCPHCAPQRRGAHFGHALALLGLTLTAGCPGNVSAKYGAEVVDTDETDEGDTDTDEPAS
jgi:hypothetical protein